MDFTRRLSTLIIVDVWFGSSLRLEVSDETVELMEHYVLRRQNQSLRHFVFYHSLPEHQEQWD